MRSNRKNRGPWVRKKWVIFLVVACGRVTGEYVVTEPEDLGVNHLSEDAVQSIVEGTLEPPDYSSAPATSGPHAPAPTPCGIYRQEIPEIFNVHALEHGAVIFYYREDLLSEEERTQLEDLGLQLNTHVIVMPFSGMESPMALVAWGKLAELGAFDLEAARGFWSEFAQLGPESGIACDVTVNESQAP